MYHVPVAVNEPILNYSPGSKEKKELKAMLAELKSKVLDIPMFIGGKEVRTEDKREIRPPHEHKHLLGYYYQGDREHMEMAIDAALAARKKWQSLPWNHRASIFLKAADLIAGPYRQKSMPPVCWDNPKTFTRPKLMPPARWLTFSGLTCNLCTRFTDSNPLTPKVFGTAWKCARSKDLYTHSRHLTLHPLPQIYVLHQPLWGMWLYGNLLLHKFILLLLLWKYLRKPVCPMV
jgi:hypothetical protein